VKFSGPRPTEESEENKQEDVQEFHSGEIIVSFPCRLSVVVEMCQIMKSVFLALLTTFDVLQDRTRTMPLLYLLSDHHPGICPL
jgi:hypothetical protein